MSKDNKTFELGLTMAGAVSAGAYTAGVLDFLFQALDEWYEAKARTPEKVPSHDVVIRVISGASAGGICGALALVALAGGKAAVPAQAAGASGTSAPSPGRQRYRCWVKPLYDAWVEKPALVSDSGGPDLLGARDLNPPDPSPRSWTARSWSRSPSRRLRAPTSRSCAIPGLPRTFICF